MTSLTKILQSPTKKLLLPLQTRVFVKSFVFEQLSSTIGRGAKALVRQPKTGRPISKYEYIVSWLSMCDLDEKITRHKNVHIACHCNAPLLREVGALTNEW